MASKGLIPVANYADAFSQANENPLSSGGVWTGGYTSQNSFEVVSNSARATAIGPQSLMTYNGFVPTPQQYAQFELGLWSVGAGEEVLIGVALRMAASPTFDGYTVMLSGVGAGSRTMQTHRWTAGSPTLLATSAEITVVSGDVFSGYARGPSIFAYQNGILCTSASDATYPTGRVGLGCDVALATTAASIKNFGGGDIAAIERSGLSRFSTPILLDEDDGRFDDLDVRNWFRNMLPA